MKIISYRVCLYAFFAFIWLSSAGVASAQSFSFSGDAYEKVYGGPLCTSQAAISLEWIFTPGTAFAANKDVEFTIYLGLHNSTETGLELTNFTVTPSASSAAGSTTKVAVGGISSSRTSLNKLTSKGLFKDQGYLNIRDVIGYQRVTVEKGSISANSVDVCKLNAASPDTGVIRVKLCVEAKYNIQDTTAVTSKTFTDCHDLQFDLTPPLAPTDLALAASEKQISASWGTQKDHQYNFFVSTKTFDKDSLPTPVNGSNPVVATPYVIKNLTQQTKYYVAIRGTDAAGNQGSLSSVQTVSTVELTDFYEAYRKAGGVDKGFAGGGHCFIATAAYGTYDHRYVKILRDFRDQYLLTNHIGQAFVAWYYANSPVWADWIRKHPKTRKVVQVLLLPLIAGSAFFVRLSLPSQIFFVFGLLCLFLGWRFRKKWFYAAPVAMLLFTIPTPAQAESPRNFGMEVRAGIYQPEIDKESGLKSTPYKNVFGDPLQLYLETSLEWLVFKKMGSIGIGGSVGFTWAESKALSSSTTSSDTTQDSNKTGLWIIPLRLDVSYRFDYFVHKNGVPIVPYLRGGMDYYLWLVTDPSGAIAKDTSTQEENAAFGGRFGFHFGLGFQFLLDILDPRSARTFDNDLGVNHTYLFFEWNFSWVGVLTPGLNLSDSSFRAGLLFQF